MKQSGHLNPREETGTVCPVTSRYGRTPQNKHGGVGRQQQLDHYSANNYDNHTHNGQYNNNNNFYYIFKVQYPMYINIRVQWTVHKMAV